MVFSKSFPKTVPGSSYPQWEEVFLTEEEEKEEERKCREENMRIMKECISDAKEIVMKKTLKCQKHSTGQLDQRNVSEHAQEPPVSDRRFLTDYQTDIVNIAISLFEKRASHSVYWKESKAKEKFDMSKI